MNKQKKMEIYSQIQRTNWWLPEGRGWAMHEIGEGIKRNKFSVIK